MHCVTLHYSVVTCVTGWYHMALHGPSSTAWLHLVWMNPQLCVFLFPHTAILQTPSLAFVKVLFFLFEWLLSRVSPLLTATGFVNGNRQFSTLTESTPLNCQQIWHRWLHPWPLPLYEIWCKSIHGNLWANGWTIINIFFLFIPSLARDVIYTSHAYATMSVSVCLWWKCIGTL